MPITGSGGPQSHAETHKYQQSRKIALLAKVKDAEGFLHDATAFLQDEHQIVRDCRLVADNRQAKAQLLAKQIEAALEAGRGIDLGVAPAAQQTAQPAEQDQKKEQENAAAERQKDQATRAAALNKAQMDEWIGALFRDNRRLVADRRRIIPQSPTERDLEVMAAPNYNALSRRLQGMKRSQDGAIEAVAAAIQADPRLLIVTEKNGQATYELAMGQREWRAALAHHSDDNILAKAIRTAVQAQADLPARKSANGAAQDRSARTTGRDPNAATGAPQQSVASSAVAPGSAAPGSAAPRSPTPPSQHKERTQPTTHTIDLDAVVSRLQTEPLRIQMNAGKATLSERNLARLGIAAGALDGERTQKRLAALAVVQERALKRLTTYVASRPGSAMLTEAGYELIAKAPKPLIALAQKWGTEDDHLGAVRSILDAASNRAADRTSEAQTVTDNTAAGEISRAPAAPIQARDTTPARGDDRAPAVPARAVDSAAAMPAPAKIDIPVQEPSDRDQTYRDQTARDVRPAAPQIPKLVPVTHDEDDWKAAKAFKERQRQEKLELEERQRTDAALEKERLAEEKKRRAAEARAALRVQTRGVHTLIDRWIEATQKKLPAERRERAAAAVIGSKEASKRLDELLRPDLAKRIRADAAKAQDGRQTALGLPLQPKSPGR